MSFGASIDNRLAVYGTLAPGQPNHHVVAGAGGSWLDGTVRGRLEIGGWGAALGHPGLVPDPAAEPIPVKLLVAADLPSHLARLDEFEGVDYARVRVPVELAGATVEAWIYALRGKSACPPRG